MHTKNFLYRAGQAPALHTTTSIVPEPVCLGLFVPDVRDENDDEESVKCHRYMYL